MAADGEGVEMNRLVIGVTTVALCLTACTSGAGEESRASTASVDESPSTRASGYNGELGDIVFSQTGFTLSTIGTDGTGKQMVHQAWDGIGLSRDGMKLMSPTPAPDGRLLPLILQADGSTEHVLDVSDPHLQLGIGDWSPDGTHLVFDGWDETDDSRKGLYSVSADGSQVLQLTEPGSRHDFPAYGGAYSPDGDRVLFFRPADEVDADGVSMNLFVVDVDGTGMKKLTPRGTETILLGPSGASDWSPDGRRVAFVGSDGDFWESPRHAVFIVGADGSQRKRITSWGDVLSVQWSPNGRQLAFTLADDIYTVRPDGTDLVKLTSSPKGTYSFGPMWSPDSSRLLFIHGAGHVLDRPPAELWIVAADGADPVQVFDSPTEISGYDWVPH
jgi:Tol biopolymer transport system component